MYELRDRIEESSIKKKKKTLLRRTAHQICSNINSKMFHNLMSKSQQYVLSQQK